MAEEFDDADFLAAVSATEALNDSRGQSRPNVPAGSATGVIQPKPQALPSRQGPSAILVSTRQKGNPILNHVKGVPWEYSDIPADYVLGGTTCALFLSLKYHRLHPEYIYTRIRQLGKLYNLRVLLTMVDINNHEEALKELSKTSMINNLTLILCWSALEAGRYLELFKSYEHASPASIRARQAESYRESLTEFVTTPRNINKTDAASLISNFGTLRAAVNAQAEELALIPGWGEKKVKSWCTTVREPFRVKRAGKTKSTLARHESTIDDEADSGTSTPDQAINPIPIGRGTFLSRESSLRNPSPLSREATRPEANEEFNSSKRHLNEVNFDDDLEFDDDEEAALMAAIEADAKQPEPLSKAQKTGQSDPRKDSELSTGVAAALAKYRNSN